MYKRFEGSFQSFDSTRIFYQGWEAPNSKAHVIITHGQGEHSECYHRVVKHFEGQGISFWAWDMRGHGRSEGIRGFVGDFHDYVRDYLIFLDRILKRIGVREPIFLMAHSLGGMIQNLALFERTQEEFAGQILSAPLFGIAMEVPAIKKHAAEWLFKLFPKVTMWNEIKNEMLTRDAEIMREFEKDVLRHDRISSGVYLGMLKNFDVLSERISEIKIPTLFLCPDPDPIVDTQATARAKDKMKAEVKFLTYGDGARHEMFNDTHRNDVYKDVQEFLMSHIKDKK